MIARLKIENREIVSAVLEDERGSIIRDLPFDGDHFEWEDKWYVGLEYEGIECISSRTSKFSELNRLRYHVFYNGRTSSYLLDDYGQKITSFDRAFKTPGNFDGELKLVWNPNGHRWAELVSSEFYRFLDERGIHWVIRGEQPSTFDLNIKGRFIESRLQAEKNFNAWFNRRRGIVTDGEIGIDTIDNYSCRVHTSPEAKYLLLLKRGVESNKIQRVIYLPGSFLDVDVPTPEQYSLGMELERTVAITA